MYRFIKKAVCMTLIVALFSIFSTGCDQQEVVRIGHKNYTEQRIMGQMFALLIENNTNYKTDVKEFGGTLLVHEALKSKKIDLYGEFTGTAYAAILKQSGLTESQEVYEYVKDEYKKQFDILWLEPLGYNNTYTFTLKKDLAEQLNIKTTSDLAQHAPNLKFGPTHEFMEREDGWLGAKEVYGLAFKEMKPLDPGLRYAAIKDDKVDVIDAYSTDGKLLAMDLAILEDDKQFFPPYYVAPIVHGNVAEKYPDVVELLNKLGSQVSEEEIRQVNYQVDEKGVPVKKAAEDFLRSKGLIK